MFDNFIVDNYQQLVSIANPQLKLYFHGLGSAVKGVKLFFYGEKRPNLLGFIVTLESLFLNC